MIALGDPQPGNRNDTIVYRTSGIGQKLARGLTMADGAYRGNLGVVIPYRVEHALAWLKKRKISRDYRRAEHFTTLPAP